MTKMLRLASFAAVLLLPTLLLPTTAQAEESDPGYVTTDLENGYGVIFTDNLLNGDGIDASAPLIRGGFKPIRMLLLRPRASFVRELTKSVENL